MFAALLIKPPPISFKDNDGELEYHKGIHLCIDNCQNNGITEDGKGTMGRYLLRLHLPQILSGLRAFGFYLPAGATPKDNGFVVALTPVSPSCFRQTDRINPPQPSCR